MPYIARARGRRDFHFVSSLRDIKSTPGCNVLLIGINKIYFMLKCWQGRCYFCSSLVGYRTVSLLLLIARRCNLAIVRSTTGQGTKRIGGAICQGVCGVWCKAERGVLVSQIGCS